MTDHHSPGFDPDVDWHQTEIMDEVHITTISATTWIGPDDREMRYFDLECKHLIGDPELLFDEPSKKKYEGYPRQKNSVAKLDYWYHAGTVFFWHRTMNMDVGKMAGNMFSEE